MGTYSATLSSSRENSPKSSGSIMVLIIVTIVIVIGLSYPVSNLLQSQTNNTMTEMEIAQALSLVTLDPTYTHALEEHPDTAPLVRSCLDRNGPYMQFQIIPKQRYLRVCIIDDGIIGFQIVDIVNRVAKERTAYIKDTIHNIKELLRYAEKLGYPRFKGVL